MAGIQFENKTMTFYPTPQRTPLSDGLAFIGWDCDHKGRKHVLRGGKWYCEHCGREVPNE